MRIKKINPFYQSSGITLYNNNFADVLKNINFDFILSDVPYPDYYVDEYKYFDGMLDFLNNYSCRQLIFWSAKVDFPLSHTAVHIWDKKSSAGSSYERIFERNGNDAYLIFRYGSIHNSVRAQFESDVFYGHKSQKPVRLMRDLITRFVPAGAVIFDPFSGSGSTLAAARDLGYSAIGCEISEKWCNVSKKRLSQQSIFNLINNKDNSQQINFIEES